MCISDISTSISTDYGNLTAVQISESFSGSLLAWRPLEASGIVSCSLMYITASIQTKDRLNNCEDMLYMYVGTGSMHHHDMPRRRISTDDGFQFTATEDQKALVFLGGATSNNVFAPINLLPVNTKLVAWKNDMYQFVRITENRHMCNWPASTSLEFKDNTKTSQRRVNLASVLNNYPYSESKTYTVVSESADGTSFFQSNNATLSQSTLYSDGEVVVYNTHNSVSLAENFRDAVNSSAGHNGKLLAKINSSVPDTVLLYQTDYTASSPAYSIGDTTTFGQVLTGAIPSTFEGALHGHDGTGQNLPDFNNWRCTASGVPVDFIVGGTNSYQLANGIVLKGFAGNPCSCGPDASIFEYPCNSSSSFCVSESIEFRFSGSDTGDFKEWKVSSSPGDSLIFSSDFINSAHPNPFGITQNGNWTMDLGPFINPDLYTASICIDITWMHDSASQWPVYWDDNAGASTNRIGPSNQMNILLGEFLSFQPNNITGTYDVDETASIVRTNAYGEDMGNILGYPATSVNWANASGSVPGYDITTDVPQKWFTIGLTASAAPWPYRPYYQSYALVETAITAQIGGSVAASAAALAVAVNEASVHPTHSVWLKNITASSAGAELCLHWKYPGTWPHTQSLFGHYLNMSQWDFELTGSTFFGAPTSNEFPRGTDFFEGGENPPAATQMTLSWFNSSSNANIFEDASAADIEYKLPQEINVCWNESIYMSGLGYITSSCCVFLQLNKQPYSSSYNNFACQVLPGFSIPLNVLGIENYDTITYNLQSGGAGIFNYDEFIDTFIPDPFTYQQGVYPISFTASVSNSLCINSASNQPSFSSPLIPTVESTPSWVDKSTSIKTNPCCSDISGTINVVANPGITAGKDSVQCWPTMSLMGNNAIYGFPQLGSPTWSIAGATLNNGVILGDYNHGQSSSVFPHEYIYFGKNSVTDSHSLFTEMYLLDKNYSGIYTMSIAISHSGCSYTDTCYIKMVSCSVSTLDMDACLGEGSADNPINYKLTATPQTPGLWTTLTPGAPGYPIIFAASSHTSDFTQAYGSTCVYLWTAASTSVHELGGEMHSITCYASDSCVVNFDENPGIGTFIGPDITSFTYPAYFIGGGGCCPNDNYYISRSFEMAVPGLALNTPVTLSVYHNEQYGYDPASFYNMGFGSGSAIDEYNRKIHNSASGFLFNATNSAQSHSEDIINTSNISSMGQYTSSHLYFRASASESFGKNISMSFSVPGALGICENNVDAKLTPLHTFADFDIKFHSSSTAFYHNEPTFNRQIMKAGNINAVTFQHGHFNGRMTASSVLTQEGYLVPPITTYDMGGIAPYITTSYIYCGAPYSSPTNWNNGAGVLPPRAYWYEGGGMGCSAAAPTNLANTAYWPFILTSSGHVGEMAEQPFYQSGSGIVTNSYGQTYTTTPTPLNYYGSPDGLLFEWNAVLIAIYHEDGDPNSDYIYNAGKYGYTHGKFADTWKTRGGWRGAYSHFEAPTYFPPICGLSSSQISGWPTDALYEESSSADNGGYGRAPVDYFSASIEFSVTASPINRPDMVRYASMSIMFVTMSSGNTSN